MTNVVFSRCMPPFSPSLTSVRSVRARLDITWPTRHHAYSSLVSHLTAEPSETVRVDCRSNGTISLNIYQPAVNETAPPVIVYLPTAPAAKPTWGLDDDHILSALSASSNAVIVRVNYRLGGGVHYYPTPVHDVLAGYEYVKARFQARSSTTKTGSARHVRQHVGVCGQLVGGSLAAMLALTESRLGEDRIAAAALNCPLTDWVFPDVSGHDLAPLPSNGLDEAMDLDRVEEELGRTLHREQKTKQKKQRKTMSSWETHGKIAQLPTTSLLEARKTLFRKPGHYFDPFASPTLFLRSPGAEIPEDAHERCRSKTYDVEDNVLVQTSRTRKAHRTFPPTGSSLVLPDIRVSVGAMNPLYDQAEEFVKLLRRSIVRNVQARGSTQAMLERFSEDVPTESQRRELAIAAAEQRIEYHLHADAGLWGSPEQHCWLDEVWKVGAWFRKMLK